MLQFQRDRDAAGGGVVLRSVADAALNDAAATPGLRRADAKAHVLRSIDRLLSDEARTAALESAADAATAGGRCSALVLGAGSLLPALLLARRGAAVCVVEASPLLADVVRAAAVENGVRLAVLSSLASASAAYRQPGVSPPSLLVSEAVDDGLLADGVLPSLRAARALLASSRGGGGDAVAVLPRAASVEASLLQLGFSGVPGFGLDGVDIDLRHFDALRPRGVRARLPPGYWPVRLSEWKQPQAAQMSTHDTRNHTGVRHGQVGQRKREQVGRKQSHGVGRTSNTVVVTVLLFLASTRRRHAAARHGLAHSLGSDLYGLGTSHDGRL